MNKTWICVLSCLVLTACGGAKESASIQGQDFQDGVPHAIPDGIDSEKGSGCASDDPNHICLAVKYVVYQDASGVPIVSETGAQKVIDGMNSLWSQCNLSFVIDEYAAVAPASYGLAYQTANKSDLTTIRKTFQNDHTLLIVTTGTWNRNGTLGSDYANAWTMMPGTNVNGAILERPVSTNSNLIAHEIGHYLNLDHVNDSYAMMSSIIYSYSENIYASQCTAARQAAWYFWTKMLR